MTRIDAVAGSERFLLASLLAAVLLLVYSSTFQCDYLMNDELALIGTTSAGLVASAKHAFLFFGRLLSGAGIPLVFDFVGYEPARIQALRLLNLVSLAAVAALLFVFVAKRSGSDRFAFLLVLFLFTQLPFQGIMGYSLALTAAGPPAMWLSLLAFGLHFSEGASRRLPPWLRSAIVLGILLLALQATQALALFSLVPLTWLALADGTRRKGRILGFLGLAVLALLVSTFVYAIGLEALHRRGTQGYDIGESAVKALAERPLALLATAINPLNYWSAFKLWSYPYPFDRTPPLGDLKRSIAFVVLGAWSLLPLAVATLEWRHSPSAAKREVASRWLLVLVCLGLGAVWLLADSPQALADHRPHITLTLTGIVVFVAGYCLRELASRYPMLSTRPVAHAALVLVILSCLGAQSGVLRGIVLPRADELGFVRSSLIGDRPVRSIAIVLPSWNGCIREPCDPWMGNVVSSEWHLMRPGLYRYALATIGEPPDVASIQFVEKAAARVPAGVAVVDWNAFVRTRKP